MYAQLTKFQFITQQFFISIFHTPYNTQANQNLSIKLIQILIMRIHFQDQSIMRWKENRNINFILQFPIPSSAFISNFNYFPLKIELFHSKITFQNSFFPFLNSMVCKFNSWNHIHYVTSWIFFYDFSFIIILCMFVNLFLLSNLKKEFIMFWNKKVLLGFSLELLILLGCVRILETFLECFGLTF